MAIPDQANRLRPTDGGFRIDLQSAQSVRARTVIVARGARYRRLEVAELDAFEGSAVHHWASPAKARLCSGQAVVFLAGKARKVWLIVRAVGLEATISRYLIDRIASLPNVKLVTQTEVSALESEGGALAAVHWRHRRTGETMRRPLAHLFLFIGADLNTDWLEDAGVALDPKGFLLTGPQQAGGRVRPLETSLPGVFAMGDVRIGSIKRVAAAVGEGAQVVAALHGRHADMNRAAPAPGAA